jgi:hypothetical protein
MGGVSRASARRRKVILSHQPEPVEGWASEAAFFLKWAISSAITDDRQ